MSQHIKIQGLPEHTFTKFAGDVETGMSLQITVDGKVIQLNKGQVQMLIRALAFYWGNQDLLVSK